MYTSRYVCILSAFCALLMTTACGSKPASIEQAQTVQPNGPNAQRAQAPQEPSVTGADLAEFNQHVKEYAELHKRLAKSLGDIDDTKKPAEITAHEVALGQAIRSARSNAKAGDIFAPRASILLKQTIATTYRKVPEAKETEDET